jgi:hypothetical protein
MYVTASERRLSVVLALCAMLLCGAQAGAQVFVEDFNDDHIDPDHWAVDLYGSGAQIAEVNQELQFTMPSNSSGTEFGSRLVSHFLLRGDFDIHVDFSLLQWPYYNGVRTAIGLTDSPYDDYGVARSSLSASESSGAQEVYVADFGPFVLVPTQAFTGKLRLVRSGDTQTGYYSNAGEWIPILMDSAPTSDIAIQLHAWSHDYAFQHQDVRAAFDNFTVTTGQVVWNYYRVGDMNCDGTYGYLSFGDINPFVLYLSNFATWQTTYPGCPSQNGDINGDGTYGYLSFGDINPFVALLSGGG